ncbi:hypothetical protein BZB76_6900 [Actinomadura pelletieri DSM 43383]|uniref:Uncharacterized protein n=1 Tax=Actinomadura pelletieri DSM 43383 TaxID=1120940 RepID=A0A495Q996_9ACTN|nr:hypothetical protein [Actinomadura pelletieri]RKS67694.1 hypothetical protein BZB76_6900 [Actinomadura pelletieri DSM 43383]
MTDNAPITISDQHVAALRTFLVEGSEVWLKRHENLLKDETDFGYSLLLYAAFTKAAEKRFSPVYSVPQLIQYVADHRLSLEEHADELNPRVAEKLLRFALGDESLSERPPFGMDPVSVARAEMYLLMALIEEAKLNDAELEKFIKDSSILANEWAAADQEQV